MRLLATVLALAWGAAPVAAVTLAGVVRDASRTPLPGVQVTVHGDSTEREAITGFDSGPPILVAPEKMMLEAQPRSRVRIVAMGDSTTAGTPAFKSPRAPERQRRRNNQCYWL